MFKNYQSQILVLLKYVLFYGYTFLRVRLLGRNIVYPRVINFSPTNKCNYRCVMCNVWKPEYASGKDMSPEEIEALYSKPMFKKVTHVGVSGGEPFIRKDIVEVVKAIVRAIPTLKSLSIITNGSFDFTTERAGEIKEFLDSQNIHYDLEISLDGIGEIQDINRGVKGAFERTYENFMEMKKACLVSRISITITKFNCNHLWQMYEFAREHDVQADFRLASPIARLYNEDLIGNFEFTEEEKLKIIKFFENLIHYYEHDIHKQIRYTSLIGMLRGNKRKSGCYWQTSFGTALDPYGNLFFCFPKSEQVTNINDDVEYDISLLKEHEDKLLATHEFCDSCTHGYAGLPDFDFVVNFFYKKFFKARVGMFKNTIALKKTIPAGDLKNESVPIKTVTILGWYGTETLGDKAILGGIIRNLLKEGLKKEDITVLSLHDVYTELTLKELNITGVSVRDIYKVKKDKKFITSQDLFIFGGGPLCDVEPMIDMYEIFYKAKKLNKKTFVYGVGLGPLNSERYKKAAKKLLSISDKISFRDKQSLRKYGDIVPVQGGLDFDNCFIDPSVGYVRSVCQSINNERPIEEKYVLFCLRDWPFMYAHGLSYGEYTNLRKQFNEKVIQFVDRVNSLGFKAVLFPMHSYYVGDDDREYYLEILKEIRDHEGIVIIAEDYKFEDSIRYFKYAEFTVAMRFHSIVFSISVNTPCIAIDYSLGGGKGTGFMNTVGLKDNLYSVESFAFERPEDIVNKIKTSEYDWHYINSKLDANSESLFKYMSIKEQD